MNIQAMMREAQKLQKEMMREKEAIDATEYEGESSFVKVKVNGKKEVLEIKIDQETLDKEDIEMLEDFIVLAQKQALADIDKEFQSKMGQYAGMLDGLM